MKRVIIIIFILNVWSINAQTDYYAGRDTLHRRIDGDLYIDKIDKLPGSDIFYIIRHYDGLSLEDAIKLNDDSFYLRRKDAKLFAQPMRYTDGTVIYRGEILYYDIVSNPNDIREMGYKALREVLSRNDVQGFYDRSITLLLILSPDGDILEITFQARPKIIATVPSEKWALLDKKLKEYVHYELSGADKYQFVQWRCTLYIENIFP